MIVRQWLCIKCCWAEMSSAPQALVLCTCVGYHLPLYSLADNFYIKKQFCTHLLGISYYICPLTERTYTGFDLKMVMHLYFSIFLRPHYPSLGFLNIARRTKEYFVSLIIKIRTLVTDIEHPIREKFDKDSKLVLQTSGGF